MAPPESDTLPREGAEVLSEARERTLTLVDGIDERDLNRVHDPLNSPLVWDLGHIAAFEELWLCRNQAGLPALHPELLEVYDACETPRAARGEMPYLRRDEALRFMDAVRERTL